MLYFMGWQRLFKILDSVVLGELHVKVTTEREIFHALTKEQENTTLNKCVE